MANIELINNNYIKISDEQEGHKSLNLLRLNDISSVCMQSDVVADLHFFDRDHVVYGSLYHGGNYSIQLTKEDAEKLFSIIETHLIKVAHNI